MIEWLQQVYPQVRLVHIAAVIASGTLFAARGLGVLARGTWPMRAAVRHASVAIDVLLLAAGVTLWTVLSLNPVRDAWLGAKLVLLVVYIVVGSIALKRGRTPRGRAVAFVVALVLYASIVAVARGRDPWLGLLAAA